MTFVDLTDFLDDDGLHVTVRGKEYLIPSPDADTGMRLNAIATIGAAVQSGKTVPESQLKSLELNDDEERNFTEQVLGSALEELRADGFSWVQLSRMAQYAFTHFAISPETARKGLAAGVFDGGKAPARTPGKKGKARSGRPASTGSKKIPTPAGRAGLTSTSTGDSSS